MKVASQRRHLDTRSHDSVSRPLSEIKADLFKALAHPGRVRILEVLRDGDHSVGDLLPAVGLESSHLSQQLAVLRRAGVVSATRAKSSVIYSIADPAIVDLLAAARSFLVNSTNVRQGLLADGSAR